jgi:hypothetical protein
VNIEHFIIKNLPELEAHNKLFDMWEKNKREYELFIKIDADTILHNEYCVSKILNEFKKNDNITGMQVKLLDYFTNNLINGLNCFNKNVLFNTGKDKLFCDRVDSNHKIHLKNKETEHLLPIGYHCKYPNDLQSFHFGLHRFLKNQKDIIMDVYKQYSIYQDKARFFALMGAIKHSQLKDNINYTDKFFHKEFATVKYDALHQKQIRDFFEKC